MSLLYVKGGKSKLLWMRSNLSACSIRLLIWRYSQTFGSVVLSSIPGMKGGVATGIGVTAGVGSGVGTGGIVGVGRGVTVGHGVGDGVGVSIGDCSTCAGCA